MGKLVCNGNIKEGTKDGSVVFYKKGEEYKGRFGKEKLASGAVHDADARAKAEAKKDKKK